MSIADLFESGERKQHKGHFRNLVMIARADGHVSIEESELLQKIAKHIGISKEQAQEIIDNPKGYAINPPVSKEERFRRLVNLVEMVNADGVFDDDEIALLRKYGVALGFSDEDILDAIDATINGMEDGKSEDEIVESLI